MEATTANSKKFEQNGIDNTATPLIPVEIQVTVRALTVGKSDI